MAKKEIKSAPHFDEYLQEAQSQPIVKEQDIKDHLLRIYEKMKGVAVCGGDEYRNIWFHIPRGNIRDFGNFKEFLKEGVVRDRAGFEELWLGDYPEALKWYELAVSEYNGEYCRSRMVSN